MLEARELDAIVDALVPGAMSRDVRRLAGGVSADTVLLTLTGADGRRERYVVRHRPPETSRGRLSMTQESGLMAGLHAAGLPVPKPLLQWSPETFVMTWIEGSATLPPGGARLCAEVLAGIHRQRGPFVDALPSLEDPVPLLERVLSQAGITRSVRELMAPGAAERCLLHGDFWPANLLWENGRLAAVLDWEHAATGDPLSDVACSRVELEVAEGEASSEVFTERYFELTRRPRTHLVGWDLYVSAAALDSMETWGLAPEVFRHRWAVTTAFRDRALASLASSARG